jgi:Spy/CpxP family protein refolding chaperone
VKPRHTIYAVLATLVIFAAGVVTGGLLVRNVLPGTTAPPPGSGWQMARLEQFQRAVNQLDLTPEQRMQANRLARERAEYVADMARILDPELPAVLFKLRRDINQLLTPEQRVELDHRWNQIQNRRFPNRPDFPGNR